MKLDTKTICYCVVALLLGMLLANMLKNVCGCKSLIEGLDPQAWLSGHVDNCDELTISCIACAEGRTVGKTDNEYRPLTSEEIKTCKTMGWDIGKDQDDKIEKSVQCGLVQNNCRDAYRLALEYNDDMHYDQQMIQNMCFEGKQNCVNCALQPKLLGQEENMRQFNNFGNLISKIDPGSTRENNCKQLGGGDWPNMEDCNTSYNSCIKQSERVESLWRSEEGLKCSDYSLYRRSGDTLTTKQQEQDGVPPGTLNIRRQNNAYCDDAGWYENEDREIVAYTQAYEACSGCSQRFDGKNSVDRPNSVVQDAIDDRISRVVAPP